MLLPLLLQALARAPAPQPFPGDMPDVVVFLLDDVGARDYELLSAETPSRVPHMDALAARGTRFVNGFAQPMCAPSRFSLYLSDWQGETGGFACAPNEDGTSPGPTALTLSHGCDSLPKALEGAGYRTGLFGRWGMGTWLGDDPGSQEYAWTPMLWGFETWRAGLPDGVEKCNGPSGNYSDWLRVDDGEVSLSNTAALGSAGYHTIALREAFLEWWRDTPGPRFALVAFQAAHEPMHWPPPEALPPGWKKPSPDLQRHRFEAMIQSADLALGAMLAEIDLQQTLVFLLSDNGTPITVPPAGYSKQKVKTTTYNGGVRVPFLVAGLDFPAGHVSTQPVSVVDLVPTLADLARVCRPQGHWDGQSLLPALDGIPLERPWVYVQKSSTEERAVIEERWKLRQTDQGQQQLYDLLSDPFEHVPLDPDTPGFEDITLRLRLQLARAQS